MEDNDNEKEPMLYELAYILESNIAEEHLNEHSSKITANIEKLGGSIVLADNPKLRALAYTIEKSAGGKRSKYNQGYFGWIKFTLIPTSITELENGIKLIPEVIRHMIIHTVKQAPAYVPRKRVSATGEVGDNAGKLIEKPTEAELDKEVENLIASTATVQ